MTQLCDDDRVHATTGSTLDRLLATAGSGDPVDVPPDWWSWDGVHGGLVVALGAAAAARDGRERVGHGVERDRHGGDRRTEVRSVVAQLHRAARGPVGTANERVHAGTTVTVDRTTVASAGRPVASVTTVAGRPTGGPTRDAGSIPVERPERYDTFVIPADLVPFARHLEVRPVSASRPLAGGPEAHLVAWVRLADDDAPVDLARLLVLLDALPPSLFATLTDPLPVPTIEMTVHPAPVVGPIDDPWVLVDTRTEWSRDGWVGESATAHAADGRLLAHARQVRVCQPG